MGTMMVTWRGLRKMRLLKMGTSLRWVTSRSVCSQKRQAATAPMLRQKWPGCRKRIGSSSCPWQIVRGRWQQQRLMSTEWLLQQSPCQRGMTKRREKPRKPTMKPTRSRLKSRQMLSSCGSRSLPCRRKRRSWTLRRQGPCEHNCGRQVLLGDGRCVWWGHSF